MKDKHKQIIDKVSTWLKSHSRNIDIPNCATIAKDLVCLTNSGEIPDVIGWCYWTSVLIEVKVSRQDFLGDKKKVFRIDQSKGVGEYRYYCCPSELIKESELPDNWGLMYYSENGKIELIQKAQRLTDINNMAEKTILLSIIRRQIT